MQSHRHRASKWSGALLGLLLLSFGTACTHTTYKTEIRRGDLVRTTPAGNPAETGKVSLDIRPSIRGQNTLALDVTSVIERHRPLRREYEQNRVKHQVSLKPGDAVVGELANLAVTLGLGHLLFWDWSLGLPKVLCLPRSKARDGCQYTESARALDESEEEQGFEIVDPMVSRSRSEEIRLGLKLTSTKHGNREPVEWSGGAGSQGLVSFDLQKLVPDDESRLLLEVTAHRTGTEDGTHSSVIARKSDGFALETSESAVVSARKDIDAAREAWSLELARREAAEKEAARKVAEERSLQQERARQRRIAKLCPGGVYGYLDLTRSNPYDVKGKCYEFIGSNLQTFSRSRALYNSQWGDTYYLDFAEASAPRGLFHGYTKGVGVFEYETVTGAQRVVPSLLVVELPDPVPASPR